MPSLVALVTGSLPHKDSNIIDKYAQATQAVIKSGDSMTYSQCHLERG